jgi:hypothetical protein
MSFSECSAIEMTDALRGPRGRLSFGANYFVGEQVSQERAKPADAYQVNL